MNTNELHAYLKAQIISELGIEKIDASHCKLISEKIFLKTKNYLSESTLKRFFGFAHEQPHLSPFVLNSLSQFAGYKSWEGFCNSLSN